MEFPRLLLSVALVAALPAAMTPANAETSWPICGHGKRVTCIVDGDTFWKDGIKYRLAAVNTPESGVNARCSKERLLADAATSHLRELMQVPGLSYHPQGRDRYGRVLVSVRTDYGDDIAALMVESGYGRPYAGGYHDPHEWCQ
ncbi:thermonuclease family protein [Sinorhizobium meliloti]|uniref:thermonuclease family protein n=1 Tax=Rhizobium meliloti TaxID=382 RepID=UPI000FD79C96|nr:thermonuclease family protein [Sinorhizobium meliloti]RVM01810.1 thermonuclease family protein [Sinorhizobium meliloti]RVO20573.1 thermonuclease family protein [Sinorhizobium meliloti]